MAVVELDKLSSTISTITLNRPERLNAMTFELVGQLHDALDEVSADADCKVVILTGAGRAFCAGLDLRDFGRPPAPGEHRRINKGIDGQAFMSNITVHLRQTPQIVIAAVRGAAFGGGLAIACACDVRIAADNCTLLLGLHPHRPDRNRHRHQLPAAAADRRLTGGRPDLLRARDRRGRPPNAWAWSPRSCRRGADARRVAYADMVAAHTHTGLVLTKEVLWHNVDSTSMPAAIAIENRNQSLAMNSPEVRAHMQSYSERVKK